MQYSKASKDGQPSGQNKVSVLKRCSSYGDSENHWHPTERVKSSAYCGRTGSSRYEKV